MVFPAGLLPLGIYKKAPLQKGSGAQLGQLSSAKALHKLVF